MSVFIHETAIVEKGAKIGKGTRIWHHAHVREKAVIGDNCVLGKNVYVDNGVRTGSGVKLENNVCVYDVVIGDDVELGPGVVITNDLNPRAFIWNEKRRRTTQIKKGASVGANSTIMAGITIGEYAMVGAGSVVTRDVGRHELVYGNPAKKAGHVCKCGKKIDEGANDFVCSKCRKN
jgi:acetyltransferase-like isoleucine patch superfamily enzyme